MQKVSLTPDTSLLSFQPRGQGQKDCSQTGNKSVEIYNRSLGKKKSQPTKRKKDKKKPKHVYTKPSLPLCFPETFQTQPSGLN